MVQVLQEASGADRGQGIQLRALYESAVGTPRPGKGKLAFRVREGLGGRFPLLARIVRTRCGVAVTCPSRRVLAKAVKLISPESVAQAYRSKRLALEVLSGLGKASSVDIQAAFYATPGLFRPRWCHRVWRLAECASSSGLEGETLAPGEVHVVLIGSRVVARASLITFESPHFAVIGNVFTLAEFRRRGLGSSVVSAVASEILARGRWPMYSCSLSNEASLGLCRALGFRRFATSIELFRA